MVDEGDAAAVRKLRRHLVSQDGPRSGAPDLLQVAAAEPAGQDTDDPAIALRLGHVCQARLTVLVQYDCAHVAIVGRQRKEPV
jgi:hypothetical protein